MDGAMGVCVSVFNFKGGTAKSATAANLGAALSELKRRVCLVDLDGQRTLSFALGVDGKTPTALEWLEGEVVEPISLSKYLSIVPGSIETFRASPQSGQFKKALEALSARFDVVILDCPPSLSAVPTQALLAAERVLLPTLCEPASLKGVAEAVQLIRSDRQVPIDVLRVRYKPRLVLTQQADESLVEAAGELGYHLLYTTVPENVAVAEAVAAQQPITEYAPKSPGAKAYQSLAKEVRKLWGI
jgi:chromosome partitioning protein